MLFRVNTIFRNLARYRSTRTTPEGTRFLFFTLAVGVAAVNTGNNLFYLLLAMMLSIILMSGIFAEQCLRRLEFHRHLPDLIFANEPATATLVVTNRKSRLPSFSLRLFDVIGEREIERGLTIRQLLPHTSQMLSYPLVATRRGRLHLGAVRVVTPFPFGLFIKKADYPLDGSVIVCPEIKPLAGDLAQEIVTLGHEHNLHRRGYGSDLYNLRQYQTGDDSRNIHWGITAKTSLLIVRETEAEEQRRITLVLSTVAPASHDSLFEEAVATTASLAWHLSVRGYQIRLDTGATLSPFGQGDTHLTSLLETLALCERRSPDMVGNPADDFLRAHGDEQEGATIALLPWNGPGMCLLAGIPDLVIDETVLGRGPDAV